MKKLLVIMCLCCAVALGAQAHAATARIVDSSQMDLTAINAVEGKSSGGVPVGTVIAWPVANNPEDGDKWLECNGQSISSANYPELVSLIGGKVPDYQGLFLRGVGGNSAALGTQQGSAVYIPPNSVDISITNLISNKFGYPNHNDFGDSIGPSAIVPNSGGGGSSASIQGKVAISTGASETRPANMAVRYLIRALP